VQGAARRASRSEVDLADHVGVEHPHQRAEITARAGGDETGGHVRVFTRSAIR
jgi:hypothetical protein